MHTAQWMSSVFGPFLVILGLWVLFYSENISKIATSLKGNPSCFYLMAIVKLLIGLSVINTYNVWTMTLPVALTIFGWYMLLRGVMVLFVPQMAMKCWNHHAKNPKAWGFVHFVWGIILCYLAFWM